MKRGKKKRQRSEAVARHKSNCAVKPREKISTVDERVIHRDGVSQVRKQRSPGTDQVDNVRCLSFSLCGVLYKLPDLFRALQLTPPMRSADLSTVMYAEGDSLVQNWNAVLRAATQANENED